MTNVASHLSHNLKAIALGLAFALAMGIAPMAHGQVPTTGPYAATVYSASRISKVLNVPYSTRGNPQYQQFTTDLRKATELLQDTLTMELDVYMPPSATASTPQPLVVWLHPGDLFKGSKEQVAGKLNSYARAGYVAAGVNYRMNKAKPRTPADSEAAYRRAVEDVANSVRFLRVNANTFGIDPTRVAIMGQSSGGVLSLMMGTDADTLPGTMSDFPDVLAQVDAVVSTGSTLVQPQFNAFSMLTTDELDADALMFHADPIDSTTGATWSGAAVPTCNWIASSGNTCQLQAQPNLTHVVNLNVGVDPFWPMVREFFWPRLRLQDLRP